ncbi:hypothetical protein ANO14919_138210 [Xylariales sp. No.14919]|nr:hypothetical protein ANO14919_041200 [Xylariales sp. No.14919]GAW24238.1 hypothetical protein ANO14919_138210 [Xylariales sp. No.14919]
MNNLFITPNPEVLDPTRSYAKRHSPPNQIHKHLASHTTNRYAKATGLHLRSACLVVVARRGATLPDEEILL